MDQLETMALLGNISPPWTQGVSAPATIETTTSIEKIGVAAIQRTLIALTNFSDASQKIDADDTLTSRGKRIKKAELARQAATDLAKLAAEPVKRIRDNRQSMQEQARSKSVFQSDTDRLLATLIVLQSATDLTDPLTTEVHARDALNQGDMMTFEALASLPPIHPAALSPQQLQQLDGERLESVDPAVGRALAGANELARDVDRIYGGVIRHLDEVSREAITGNPSANGAAPQAESISFSDGVGRDASGTAAE